jgi:AhpD family alkylhydroperoxidase
MAKLPASGAGKLSEDYPAVWSSVVALGKSSAEAGPLDARTRRLIKLALAVGAGSEGAVHSHARQAREEGIPDAELRQVVLLSITTLGFPAAMAAYSWVNDTPEP